MRRIRGSLTFKVFLLTAIILILACSLTYSLVYHFVPITEVNITSDKFSSIVETFPQKTLDVCKEELKQFETEYSVETELSRIYDTEPGVGTYAVVGVSDKTVHVVDLTDDVEFRALDGYKDNGVAVHEYVVKVKDITDYYYVTLKFNDKKVNQMTYAFQNVLPWLAIGIIVMSILVSIFYARYIMKPIVLLAKDSKKKADLESEEALQIHRKDEIGILADNMNYLYTQLKDTIDRLQDSNEQLNNEVDSEKKLLETSHHLFAAISHELKTPITIVKGQIEGMIGEVGDYKDRDLYLKKSYEVMMRMETLVQEIIYLSKLQTLDKDDPLFAVEHLNLSDLIRGQLADKIDLLEGKHMKLEVEVEDKVYLDINRQSMDKVISNLYGNAIAYSKEGASIVVKMYSKEGTITFSIENTGVHIPDDIVPELFKPFYRVEESRNRTLGGSGLGLYIVKTVLEKYEIDYSMTNTEDGVQFCFHANQQNSI